MAAEKDARAKILEDAIFTIEKNFGKGSIMKLGDGVINKVESISTGSISLDYARGIGGILRGRLIEIYGPESSGKTTLWCLIFTESMTAG